MSVQWQVTPITASTSDVNALSGTVFFAPGVNSTVVPLSILDDQEPEFEESLTVELFGETGGARIGERQSTVVNILANDDPNGAVGESHFFTMDPFVHYIIGGQK